MKNTLDAYGEKVDGLPVLTGWKRFYYHYILCYYGFEEDAYNQINLSLSESGIKLAHLVIGLANLALVFFIADNDHLRIWLVSQSVSQFLVTVLLFLLANRNDFKRRLFNPPSTAKPGLLSSIHHWMDVSFFAVIIITLLVIIWGVFPLFLLHHNALKNIFYWIIVFLYFVSVTVLAFTIKISLEIIKTSI